MQPLIVSERIGFSNSILIVNGNQSVLVDTGVKGNLDKFKRLFNHYGLKPGDIKLIILTHVHYDHTGNLHELVALTGAKVMVHNHEYEMLKNGFIPIPTGLGHYSRLITNAGKIVFPTFASPKPFVADLTNMHEFDLTEFGLKGNIISTPGHTLGSQSVIIGKSLISGDTFINMRNGIVFPHFANDPVTLLKTWEILFESGIEVIYPGHGQSFQVQHAFQDYEKWKVRLKKNLPQTDRF